ncbi:phage protease [Thiovibrio frasassiensis]|uniref:Phage protease n=1 Tax=Thiovibrio frasassiensis TaxID=2984131 RepID=A0A9X4RKW0_9BACT|nr:phage protease [Thiovibrio frasassiensis]MDG4475431.1 phage protease [Thiovibrio frasassiensis]
MRKKCTGIAMNSQADRGACAALNFEFHPGAVVPDWIMLLPAGPEIKGRDGRSWLMADADARTIIDTFVADKQDLPVDIEHATELKAPKGDSAPAVGWIKELELRDDGSIWGRVEWNNDGGFTVSNRQYRYISPVFRYHKLTKQILRLTSAALTNQPNLALQALNTEGQLEHEEEPAMKKIYAALGLADTATETEALNAITKLQGDLATAANRAETPSLASFVPRADYDTALNRAAKAEQTIADLKKADMETAINTEISAALAAGKITPATVDYHKASCRQEGGLDRFKDFVKAAPTVADDSGLDGKDPDKDKGLALNADQTKIAEMFGNSAEDLKKYGAQA